MSVFDHDFVSHEAQFFPSWMPLSGHFICVARHQTVKGVSHKCEREQLIVGFEHGFVSQGKQLFSQVESTFHGLHDLFLDLSQSETKVEEKMVH